MAVRVPPNVAKYTPQVINKNIGAINNVQRRAQSLPNLNDIHNLNDALGALEEIGNFVDALFPKKPKSPAYGKVMKEISGDYVRNRIMRDWPAVVKHSPAPNNITAEIAKGDDGFSRFSIDKFISNAINVTGSLAKASHFSVVFLSTIPNSGADYTKALSFMCESVEFPGRNMEISEAFTYGPSRKIPHASTYPEITLTVLCDGEFTQKYIFEGWMDYINPTSTFDFRYQNQYALDFLILQWSADGNAIYSAKVFNAFPISVQPLSASWGDDQIQKMQVTMCYRYWDATQDYLEYQTNDYTQEDYDGLFKANILNPPPQTVLANRTKKPDPTTAPQTLTPDGMFEPGQTNSAMDSEGRWKDG